MKLNKKNIEILIIIFCCLILLVLFVLIPKIQNLNKNIPNISLQNETKVDSNFSEMDTFNYSKYIFIDLKNSNLRLESTALFGYKVEKFDIDTAKQMIETLKKIYPSNVRFNVIIYNNFSDYNRFLNFDYSDLSDENLNSLPKPILEYSEREGIIAQFELNGESIID